MRSLRPEPSPTREQPEEDIAEEQSKREVEMHGAQVGPDHPKPLVLLLLMNGIYLASFTVGLDRTIVATAAPSITDEFSSPNDICWYASAYLLIACTFQPTWGPHIRPFRY